MRITPPLRSSSDPAGGDRSPDRQAADADEPLVPGDATDTDPREDREDEDSHDDRGDGDRGDDPHGDGADGGAESPARRLIGRVAGGTGDRKIGRGYAGRRYRRSGDGGKSEKAKKAKKSEKSGKGQLPLRGLARLPAAKAALVGTVVLAAGSLILLLAAVGTGTQRSEPVLQFAQPTGLAVSAELAGEISPTAGIPAELLAAYEDAQIRSGVPWGALAAVGHLTTDHGRYSPYDDACPQRDVLESVRVATERLSVELARTAAAVSQRDRAIAELTATAGRSAEQDARLAALSAERDQLGQDRRKLLETLDSLAVRSAPELLGSSWRPCLVDRDPERTVALPPGELSVLPPWDFDRATGEELVAPDRFTFDQFWWRWADTEQQDAPLAAGVVGAAVGPLMLFGGDVGGSRDPANVFDAAMILASRIDAVAYELSVRDPQRALGIVLYSGDGEQADPFWSDVFERLGVLTLLEDPEAGCAAGDGPVAYLIEVIWRCELARYDLRVVTGVSPDGSPQVASQRVGADLLVAEALRVAAGFSGLGTDRCDPGAELSGVFPLPTGLGGADRCVAQDNIAAAARLVGADASTPLSLRSQRGPFAPMLAGWGALAGAVGAAETVELFVSDGPADRGVELSASCAQQLVVAADGALSDPAFPGLDAGPATFDLWFASRRFAQTPGCGGVPAGEIERTLRRVFSQFDVHDEFGGDGSLDDEVLAARAEVLASYLSDRPVALELPPAVWGVDSFVPRLSSVSLTWPEHPGRLLAEPKPALAVGELAVPLMIRYGGTFAGDERAGTWTASLATFNRVVPALPTRQELERLHEAFEQLTGGEAPVTASALAGMADVPVATAGSYLSARRTVELSGVAPTLATIEIELYRAGDAVVLAGAVVAAPVGGIICPIAGRIIGQPNDWGYPRSGGRRHQGNDVFAATGTPVVAVRDFTVTAVVRVDTWFPGSRQGLGGLYVSYRDDRGDQWYNAHLHPGSIPSHIQQGYVGRAGEVIGHVGVSGNARDTAPHLHIERRTTAGKVNPYPAIMPACAARRS